jgi:hypothetical protein
MAGCCDGDDTANCGWVNSCVDYTKYAGGSCGTSCLQDPFVMKCTNLANPYCVKYTYPGQSVSDFGCDSTSIFGALTIRQTASGGLGSTKVASTSLSTLTAGLDAAVTTDNSYTYTGGSGGTSGGTTTYNSDTYTTGKKKLAIGAIIGIVIAVLAIGFFVIIGIVMCLKKKKKQKQIDANAQIIANNQGNRPQSEFMAQPQMQPQMQQGPTQSSQPALNSYFAPPGQQEQKYNGHTSVQEYPSPTTTPAPAYVQPYMANAPPMPQNGQYQPPANGAHEVPSPPVPQGQYAPPANGTHEVPSPISQQQYQPPVNGAHEVHSPNIAQPYNQAVSPSPVQQQYTGPTAGAHEVDAGSAPRAPGNTNGPVYEMGQGK